jgi:hypothetical protein
MQYTISAFIADKTINGMMEAVDLKGDYKWYGNFQKMEFTMQPGREVTHDLFLKMIEASFSLFKAGETSHWIPVIRFGDEWYRHVTVKEISDGEHGVFVTEEGIHVTKNC